MHVTHVRLLQTDRAATLGLARLLDETDHRGAGIHHLLERSLVGIHDRHDDVQDVIAQVAIAKVHHEGDAIPDVVKAPQRATQRLHLLIEDVHCLLGLIGGNEDLHGLSLGVMLSIALMLRFYHGGRSMCKPFLHHFLKLTLVPRRGKTT